MQAARGIKVTVTVRAEIRLERRLRRRLPLGPIELHVGDHAELLEAREVGRIDELQMGDLVAVVPIPVRRTRCRKGIETRAHGAVADGMDAHRETGGVELLWVEIKLTISFGRLTVRPATSSFCTSRAKRCGSK